MPSQPLRTAAARHAGETREASDIGATIKLLKEIGKLSENKLAAILRDKMKHDPTGYKALDAMLLKIRHSIHVEQPGLAKKGPLQ